MKIMNVSSLRTEKDVRVITCLNITLKSGQKDERESENQMMFDK